MDAKATLPSAAAWPSPAELVITWGDGHVSSYRMTFLREHCPCASCKAEKAQPAAKQDLLGMRPTEKGLESPDVEVVGRYALRFGWRDGHDTGIYPFSFLREICGCDACRAA